jgi:hypothetical protein
MIHEASVIGIDRFDQHEEIRREHNHDNAMVTGRVPCMSLPVLKYSGPSLDPKRSTNHPYMTQPGARCILSGVE